jgi:phage-related tail protein
VFDTLRRRNRKARMRNELGQSVDHFKRAATIAAHETSSTVTPKINAARDRVQPAATKAKDAASDSWDSALAALTPLVTAATENVRQAGKTTKKQSKKQIKAQQKQVEKLRKRAEKATGRSKKSRKGKLAGYALLGAAVGLGAAYAARRRREAQWDEYEPAPTTSRATGVDDAAFEPVEPVVYTTANGTTTDQGKQNPR